MMRVCWYLFCVLCVCRTSEARSKSYLITAPLSLRLDAVETVLLQLFGFTDEVTVHVFLKTSMAPDHVVLTREAVTLNTQNRHQGVARVRLFPEQLDRGRSHVVLHVQSAEINRHLSLPVSRANGFLLVQTDKPLYTPRQSVRVRAFSLNQELRPANRSVFLRFKDPDQTTVDTAEMLDVNTGVPSMQNPFKIPATPKLGVWTIEATYSEEFTTTARTQFEVKEYVLPSISIRVEPESSYISDGTFSGFRFRVSAQYHHGAPVAGAEVFLRYGYVSGTGPPVIIPNSISRQRLSSSGDVDVTLDVQKVFSKVSAARDLSSLEGRYLYVAVLLEESAGGLTQEAEFATVKFMKSPYRLSLVATPPFIKPGLPYHIQVLVKDHLGKAVNGVPVGLVRRRLTRRGRDAEEMACPERSRSQSNGLAVFVCNTPADGVQAALEFQTADPSLPAASQASVRLEAVAYHSPSRRYLYIDSPLGGGGLQVGHFANVKVYSSAPSDAHVPSLSFLVLSRGTVVESGGGGSVWHADHQHNVNFRVTAAMVPSVRLLVYYVLPGEGADELVADSVRLDVKDNCVNGLKTDVTFDRRGYKPKENLRLNIRTNEDGLVALSAVDSALFSLKPNDGDPVATVLSVLERGDRGCGGGGGGDGAHVFTTAGLAVISSAHTPPHAAGAACTAEVRPRRALSEEVKTRKALSYGQARWCCERGMSFVPKSVSCLQFSLQTFRRHQRCRQAFKECCEFIQRSLDQNQELVLGRATSWSDWDVAPSLVRSFFPESWMWEVQPVRSGSTIISRPLPDSLTTWEVRGVGVFNNGVCVSEPLRVAVSLPLAVDVPLPYQVVRGEQVELRGSVYNRQDHGVTFCVTLTASPAVCLLQSQPERQGAGLHSTACTMTHLPAGGVAALTFVLMGLEPGEHPLSFTLRTQDGGLDVLEKKLRVAPEGVRRELLSGGTLDPQGLYGPETRTLRLRNRLPANVVPRTAVDQTLIIRGEVLGDVLQLVLSPDGLRQLVHLPRGSAEAELGGLLPLVHVYRYLETSGAWESLGGGGVQENSAQLQQRIRQGVVSINSFRRGDFSYSVWRNKESSTWLTALVVQTLSLVQQVVSVDLQGLSESVSWLIRRNQQEDGSFRDQEQSRSSRVTAAGADATERSVYLTSFVLIALKRATSVKNHQLQLQFQDTSMDSAARYISQHAPAVKSVYVRAVATFALTLHDPSSMAAWQLLHGLEQLAREKGHPAVLRYWQDSTVDSDWLSPEQSGGQTVETTAYILLTVLLKGRIQYAASILAWLTQDQLYGGFFSTQDTALTLEALTEYSRVIPRAQLNQDINVRLGRDGDVLRLTLSQSRPVATPIQVETTDDITVTTGFGRGVSSVKLKTVYYQTSSSNQSRCNFDLSIQVLGPHSSDNPTIRAPHLVSCLKYRPPAGQTDTESSLTVMRIQLPTGVEAYLGDLRQFTDYDDPLVAHYELQGDTVVIQLQAVPSQLFVCVGFRIRTGFRVGGASSSLFTVTEPQDKGSLCSTHFSYEQQQLERLCVANQCQCMKAACATFRGKVDPSLTAANHSADTCRPHIRYAFKLKIVSAFAEGDFTTFTAAINEVLKNTEKSMAAVRSGTEVELVRKTSCSSVDLQKDQQYLVMGSSGTEVHDGSRYRLPLDSDVLVEFWPTSCRSAECEEFTSQLEDFALDMQLSSCQ